MLSMQVYCWIEMEETDDFRSFPASPPLSDEKARIENPSSTGAYYLKQGIRPKHM